MIQDNSNQNGNPDITFVHNWMDSIDNILQLLLSEAIWKHQEQKETDKPVMLSKKQLPTEDGLTQTVFYLGDDPILMLSKSVGDVDEIPLHYTICV